MQDDLSTSRPTAEAIRETVRGEDPSTWGARDLGHTYTPDAAAAMPPTVGPVVTDPTPATYAGAPRDPAFGPGDPSGAASTTAAAAPVARERVVDARGNAAYAEPPVERRRFSLGATFLGWAVAAFFTLVFSTLALALVGGNAVAGDGLLSFQDANGILLGSLVAYLVATFLAYVIGGYAAGRIALWDGVKHGLGTVAWAVLLAVGAILLGVYAADALDLPAWLAGFDVSDVTGETLLAIGLSLAAMLAGAMLGGKMGERYHDRVHGIDRRRAATRGRPL